jgi:TolB-like protein
MRQDEGELMLTRDVKSIANEHDAQAVLVGTYAESRNFVYVTLKVVQPQTDLVLAVDNYTLPKDDEVTTMLHSNTHRDN